MSIDKVTREKWKAEFALHAKSEGYEVTPWVTNFGVGFIRNETQALWEMYRLGRRHERCAAACALAQKRIDELPKPWPESYTGYLSDYEKANKSKIFARSGA